MRAGFAGGWRGSAGFESNYGPRDAPRRREQARLAQLAVPRRQVIARPRASGAPLGGSVLLRRRVLLGRGFLLRPADETLLGIPDVNAAGHDLSLEDAEAAAVEEDGREFAGCHRLAVPGQEQRREGRCVRAEDLRAEHVPLVGQVHAINLGRELALQLLDPLGDVNEVLREVLVRIADVSQGVLGDLEPVAEVEHLLVGELLLRLVTDEVEPIGHGGQSHRGDEVGDDHQRDALARAGLELAVFQLPVRPRSVPGQQVGDPLRVALRRRRLDPRVEPPAERRLAGAEANGRAVQADALEVELEPTGELGRVVGAHRSGGDRHGQRQLQLAAAAEGVEHVLLLDRRVDRVDVQRPLAGDVGVERLLRLGGRLELVEGEMLDVAAGAAAPLGHDLHVLLELPVYHGELQRQHERQDVRRRAPDSPRTPAPVVPGGHQVLEELLSLGDQSPEVAAEQQLGQLLDLRRLEHRVTRAALLTHIY